MQQNERKVKFLGCFFAADRCFLCFVERLTLFSERDAFFGEKRVDIMMWKTLWKM